MRKLIFLLLFGGILLLACKKTEKTDPNQVIIEQLKSAADSVIGNTKVPGLVALVVDHKRGIDWLYAVGQGDLSNGQPMNAENTFRIGSCTKTFTLTVLLQLAGEGKISLTDKLSKYFPEYPKADSITITMLCNMTSRIHDFFHIEPSLFITMRQNPTKVWDPNELIGLGFASGFDSIPGKGFGYSNTNTFILGKIIEKLTNNTLETEINNRIIRPLQLTNSGFLTSGIELPGTHGRGYYFIDYIPGEDFTEFFDVSVYWAAGAAYSTPRELQRFAEALVGGGLLPDSLQYKRLNNNFYVLPDVAYGLGIMKRGTFYGHSGEMPGFMTNMYHSNEKDCTIIIYYNSLLIGSENDPGVLFIKFLNILYGDNY